MKTHPFLLILGVLFFSCKNDAPSVETPIVQIDSTQLNNEEAKPEIVSPPQKDSLIEVEKTENEKAIVKKYGEQWDFCSCIKKLDSINEAFLSDELTVDAENALEKRLTLVDNKCKTLTTLPSNTAEDRARHQKKVNDCLKN